MKKKKKRIITIIIVSLVVIILAVLGLIFYNYLTDETRLNKDEKAFVADNYGNIQNLNVANDINIFGYEGQGVFYDFISDAMAHYNIKINPVPFNTGSEPSGLSLKKSLTEADNFLTFYEDNFVLVSKNDKRVLSLAELENTKIGVLESDYNNLSKYFNTVKGLELVRFSSIADAVTATTWSYLIVPRIETIDSIIKTNLYINYHFSDIEIYYGLNLANDSLFSNILKKYFIEWQVSENEKSFNSSTLEVFIKSIGIVQKDQDTLTNKVYNYGFVDNSPYEVIKSGNYGGIVSAYLKKFSDLSGVEFKFIKYKNTSELSKAINSNEVDAYFNIDEIESKFKTVSSLLNLEYSIVAKKDNFLAISSLNTLDDREIYVKANSATHLYLISKNLKLKTYNNDNELKKILKNDNVLVAVDTKVYDYHNEDIFKNYSKRYSEETNRTFTFKLNTNDTFVSLFTKYINFLDAEETVNAGLYNHEQTTRQGALLSKMASYILLIFGVFALAGIFIYRSTKKIRVAKKIRKEDRVRYIDQLTNLKNRNYLNENIEAWNKNTIYPQASIVMDLNDVQEINDTLGYDQGDTQIKAAANILIKTQLDNSDIIRTDGNEFLIYLVGYPEKQVVSYIRKMYKELKNLPFNYGATIGYSMIEDDVKTIEDAINEAVDDMKEKKEEISKE